MAHYWGECQNSWIQNIRKNKILRLAKSSCVRKLTITIYMTLRFRIVSPNAKQEFSIGMKLFAFMQSSALSNVIILTSTCWAYRICWFALQGLAYRWCCDEERVGPMHGLVQFPAWTHSRIPLPATRVDVWREDLGCIWRRKRVRRGANCFASGQIASGQIASGRLHQDPQWRTRFQCRCRETPAGFGTLIDVVGVLVWQSHDRVAVDRVWPSPGFGWCTPSHSPGLSNREWVEKALQ